MKTLKDLFQEYKEELWDEPDRMEDIIRQSAIEWIKYFKIQWYKEMKRKDINDKQMFQNMQYWMGKALAIIDFLGESDTLFNNIEITEEDLK